MLLSAVFPFFKPYITLCWPQSRLLQTPTWLYIEYILISEFKCFNLLFWGIAQNVRRTLCFRSTHTKVLRSPPFLHIFWWNRFSMKDNIFQHKIYPAEIPILPFFLNILKLKRNYFSKKRQNLKFRRINHVWKNIIFHWKLVSSKNMKKLELSCVRSENKKSADILGDSPKQGWNT